jgi:hypothetical protein
MVIEDKDILQADATVIAGTLISQSVSDQLITLSLSVFNTAILNRTLIASVTIGVIIPFAMSVFMVVNGYTEAGKHTMKWGFIAIIFLVAYIAILPIFVRIPK